MARLKVVVLASCMLLFGTINTLTTKFQDLAVVGHTPDGKPRAFQHPAVQSAFMFFGESLCLLPYFLMEWRYAASKGRQKRRAELERRGPTFRARRVLVFAVPAACDAVATTLLNLGLFYTFASTYQMLRGTLVLFAGFFTVLILRRRLYIHHWLGMALITGGAALVGAASVLSAHPHPAPAPAPGPGPGPAAGAEADMAAAAAAAGGGLLLGARRLASALLGGDPGVDAASAPLFGDLCVVAAQAFTALQFILEEKFVAQYRVPTLLAVGLEGAWGVSLCAVVLPLLGALRAGQGGQPIDSAAQAFREIAAHGPLAASVAVSIVSIGFFNFFGISVTKALSGAARATIDATRTLFIWLASMALGWERFLPLQVVGFAVLFAGTSLYNELIRICLPAPDDYESVMAAEEADAAGGGDADGGSEGSGYESGSSSEGEGPGKGGDEENGLTEPLLAPHSTSTAALPSAATAPAPHAAFTLAASAAAGGGAGGVPLAVPGSAVGHGHGHGHAHGLGGHGGHHAGAVHAQGAPVALPGAGNGGGARGGGRRGGGGGGRESTDSEYTMARSMRLGHSTLLPHALDADTDDGATESEGPGGYSPGCMSFGSGHTGGLLSQPNIPEGDEEGDMVGPMSGVDVDAPPSARGGGRGGGARMSIAIGPHGMLSGGVGRGGVRPARGGAAGAGRRA